MLWIYFNFKNKFIFITKVEFKRGKFSRLVRGRGAEHVAESLPAGVLQHGDALRRV
jgi:hypothetical protein